ncbi:MAG TPA: ABC transporter ATP-binding protein [Victivallales bacterium]|nr:ABC transporter ATP-binding protein [Victivallales bacterium]HRR27990.1 ABC transporter ATP-binding protein [Victivallales bacterium]
MKKNDAESGERQRITIRLIKLSWKYKAGCFKTIFIQILLLVTALSGLKFTGLGIDFIRKNYDPKAPEPVWPFGLSLPQNWSFLESLLFITGLAIAFSLIQYLLNYYDKMNRARFLQKGLVVDLRSAVFSKLQRLSFRFYDSNESAALINRVTSDVQSVRLFVDGVIIQAVSIIISLSVYLTYMISMNIRLSLAGLSTLPLIFFTSYYFSKRLKPEYQEGRKLMDELIMKVIEFINGIHVIKGFAREDYELKKLKNVNEAVKKQKYNIFFLTSIFGPIVGSLSQLNIAIILLYGGYLVAKGSLPLGSGLIVFIGLMHRLSEQINASVGIIDNIQQSIVAANRVFEIIDSDETIKSPKKPIRINRAKGCITFRNVYFEYNPGEKILEDISFEIKHGQFVGILGSVGSGKSTLLSLIPRFYDPSMGAVLLDGYDLRSLSLEDLRRQVGVVFQESFLFSKTIADNIAFGKPDATIEEIQKAAKLAAVDNFISQLPDKYDTIIKESGSDLSGGQRQRLALARAIILDPPILLLDDPTAAVDSQTEKEIFTGIEGAMRGRTTILVSNRISSLKNADIIYVLQKGRITQHGTHSELLKQKGFYRKTAEIQETGIEDI